MRSLTMINKFKPKTSMAGLVMILSFVIVGASSILLGLKVVHQKPNIILISIDAMRADHLGCYGYKKNTSPNIDKFAHQNILFEKAFAHEPWTLTSHMSLLTSLYTTTHSVFNWKKLNPAIATLGSYFKNEGYATLGFTNGIWLNPWAGFKEGFDVYINDEADHSLHHDAGYQNKLVETYLNDFKAKHLFLFMHYYDVHSKFSNLPYDAPPPFNAMFSKGSCSAVHIGTDGLLASDYLAQLNKTKKMLSSDELQCIISLYDNGIAYMDNCIGTLFTILKKFNLYDNSLIIITADHGEEFQEHGYMLHANPYYYEELIHVPLIVKLPNYGPVLNGIRIGSLVELIDIMPTILNYIGVSPFNVQGNSFLPPLPGIGNGKQFVYGFGSQKSLFIRSHKWKLLSDTGLDENRFKLFDLENDPLEKNNLADERTEIKNELVLMIKAKIHESQKLRETILNSKNLNCSAKTNEEFHFTDVVKERLKSLGYLQ
jgi:choline-sulfatase